MPDMQNIIYEALDSFGEPYTQTGAFNQDNYVLTLRIANRIYKEVCKHSHCSRTSTPISVVANTREYALPAGFVASKKVKYTVGSQDYFLSPIRESKGSRIGGSYPDSYYLIGREYIGIDPVISSSLTLTLYYAEIPTADLILTGTPSKVPADYHSVIAEGITAELFKIDKRDKTGGYAKWTHIYLASLRKMKYELKDSTNADKFYNIAGEG
jgi:hypothetical protein